MRILPLSPEHYSEALNLWELSVQVTHHFLPDGWVEEHRSLVVDKYFPMVQMHGIFDDHDQLLGFSGVLSANVEMLFVHPDYLGQGIGRRLLNHAIDELKAYKVDVNEQNTEALTFYLSQGFQVISRSELDAQGNPFPLLHLARNESISA